MASRSSPPPPLPDGYALLTRTWPVNAVFLIPFFVLYEIALLGTQSPVQNAAGAWVRGLATGLGRHGQILLVLFILLGLMLLLVRRLRDAPYDAGIYGGMLIEGLLYGAALGTLASLMAGALPLERFAETSHAVAESARGSAPAAEGMERMRLTLQNFGLAIGAGVFEELVFRGGLLFGLFAVLRHLVGTDKISAGLIALLVSSYVFSDYHHWGDFAEPYNAKVFAFRFHAGLVLGTLFLTRGLGIAALAHGFYDVLVMV